MPFYRSDPEMSAQVGELIDRLANEGRPNLHNNIAITWIRYENSKPNSLSGVGAGWLDQKLFYPASIVKLIYAIATEAWLQQDILPNSVELQRAMKDMIADSSNDATSLVVDLLTGTNSGPSLIGSKWESWQKQRLLINDWLNKLNWPELKNFNCCQKTWGDGPYGRERDFYREGNSNRNALNTSGIARFFEAVMTDGFLSPPACRRLRNLLSRSLDLKQRSINPENQVDGFLGEGLPSGSRIWSKAGWMSQARHDAAWFCLPNGTPNLLVVFTQGKQCSMDQTLFPSLAREICKLNSEMN